MTTEYISYFGSSAEVAKHLEEDSFGLVFGINTLLALVLQTLLTLLVVSEQGFALSVVDQYTILGILFFVLATFYFAALVINLFRKFVTN